MTDQIGLRSPRKEDHRLLVGGGRFGADVELPRAVHVRIVRSSIAAGDLVKVDVTEARALPAVVDVLTAADLPADLRIPVRLTVQGLDLTDHLQPVLARDVVRYVGEPVAVVVAEDPYVAEDAAELVQIEIEERDVLLDVDEASPEHVVADFRLGFGDVEAAFAAAEHVVSLDFTVGRHTAVPMETRALVVDYAGPTGELEIFGATKVPVFNRQVLASLLEVDQSSIRMHAMDAGGGFGVRGEFYPEDFLVPWVARRLRCPVSWVEDRAEHLVSVNHSREQRHRIEVALDGEGTILGLRDDVRHDNGAYIRTHGVIVPELTVAMLPGPYRVPAYDGRVRVVLTNKTPCGTYRAPGRFEGTTVREQLLDLVAAELGMERVELRRRNLLTADELPHTRAMNTLGTDVVLDTGDYPGLLDQALTEAEELGWTRLVESARAEGRRVGLGVSMFLEKSGLGPHDTADVEVTSTGRVRVHSGGTSLGQGIETVLAQIAADEFGVSLDTVDVVNGDTLLQPYGTGSWASRSTVVTGSAVRGAGREVAQRLRELGASMLEVAEDDVEIAGGQVRVRGAATNALSLADVWQAAQPGSSWLRTGEPAGLNARHRFSVDHMTYPYGAHMCVAEVDPGTGGVQVLRYLVAYEVGRAINPTLVEGQLRGGVAQGVGGALFEQFRYDESGQPQATTFMDYLMPTASEIPDVDLLVCEDFPANNPLGVRGAGEGGLTGAGAAVASAVSDALGLPMMSQLPITPGMLVTLSATGALSDKQPVSERGN
jgi:carbon-monoxide dehydrogenase large subunit/6-hydroxypseudooxynicotine dehydrogenase subunit gamma